MHGFVWQLSYCTWGVEAFQYLFVFILDTSDFEYVSNGGWYKKAFNSDHIHEGTTIIYGEYKLQKKIIKDILWRQSTNNNSIINDDKYHCHIYYRLKGK